MNNTKLLSVMMALILVSGVPSLNGCATTADNGAYDPLEPMNRVFFTFNEKLDQYFMKPVAKGYQKVTPSPVRNSVTNFFDNLFYPNVIMNDILQGKFKQGVEDFARLFINTTIGIGGLFDPASQAGLRQNNEDLGQTLAVWGTGQGPYLVIPLRGPSTVRDVSDLVTSTYVNPLFYFTDAVSFPAGSLSVVNERANLLEASEIRDEAALDSYTFTREAYLQRRNDLIYDGNPPLEEFEDFFEEEEL